MARPLETKHRILDAAERLFAEHGYEATSLRAVTAAADVNLAAVNYHFGNKEGLFGAVFGRRIDPLNAERIRRLDALEAQGDPSLEQILEAFVAPLVSLRDDEEGARFLHIVGRILNGVGEHWTRVLPRFHEVKERYCSAISQLTPHLEPDELFWRMHFIVGAMCSSLTQVERIREMSSGLCDPGDPGALLDQLVPFLTGGLQAPGRAESGRRRGVRRKPASRRKRKEAS